MKFFISLLFIFLPCLSLAHPVIYKGGLVYWGEFTNKSIVNRISYTPHPRFSLEAKFQKEDFQSLENGLYSLGLNTLIHRWLFVHSQANLYLSGYMGCKLPLTSTKDLNISNKQNCYSFQSQVMTDWESRTLYTALSLYFKHSSYTPSLQKLTYRIGFAPYKGGMKDLQSWLVAQIDYSNKELDITPMLRFFYNNVLWETGYSFSGSLFLTLMVHY